MAGFADGLIRASLPSVGNEPFPRHGITFNPSALCRSADGLYCGTGRLFGVAGRLL